MTRQLSVTKQYEHGTLIEVTPHSQYGNNGTLHAYYVPDKARKHAGMAKVQEMESPESVFDEQEGAYDWDAINELVSASDIVERAEKRVLNRTDGDIGNSSYRPWSRSSSSRSKIPAGVVKFGDPDSNSDDGPVRNPIERGRLWGTLRDDVLETKFVNQLEYQDDVQSASTVNARVPMAVIGEGQAAIAAYLAAHDHIDNLIARVLGLDIETVQDILERFPHS